MVSIGLCCSLFALASIRTSNFSQTLRICKKACREFGSRHSSWLQLRLSAVAARSMVRVVLHVAASASNHTGGSMRKRAHTLPMSEVLATVN